MKPGLIIPILLLSLASHAQSKWAIDFRPSLSFPTRHFSEVKLDIGFGCDGIVNYNITSHAAIYGGWGWTLYAPNNSSNMRGVEKTGFTLGSKIMYPFPNTSFQYYIKGGATRSHVTLQKNKTEHIDTGHEWGWQIETGVSLPLDYGISLQPGLRYTHLNGNITDAGHTNIFHLNDLSAGISLEKRF